MARGAMRGALSAAFGLTVLQLAVSQGGSSKIGGVFDVVNGFVERALDPDLPAIKDYAAAGDTARSEAAAGTTGPAPAPTPTPTYPTNGIPAPLDFTD